MKATPMQSETLPNWSGVTRLPDGCGKYGAILRIAAGGTVWTRTPGSKHHIQRRYYQNTKRRGSGLPLYFHQWVWEQANGAAMGEGLTVHHVDFNSLNNAPENLVCIPNAEHVSLHKRLDPNFPRSQARAEAQAREAGFASAEAHKREKCRLRASRRYASNPERFREEARAARAKKRSAIEHNARPPHASDGKEGGEHG